MENLCEDRPPPAFSPAPARLTDAEEHRYAELQLLGLDAARSGDTAMLTTLLRAGLAPNLRNAKGHSLLMLAAYHGHTETVSALLAYGADPDARNDRGQTPLGGAAFKGHDSVVLRLLEAGANADANQGLGMTPAVIAMMFGRFKTASLIRRFSSANRP